MSKTFFISDTHYWHNNIIDFCKRPFGSVEHMNQELIKNHNSVVQPSDHLWFLGDFSFGTVEQTEDILKQLNGIKHLIVGNHDRKGKAQQLFNKNWSKWFVDSREYFRLKVNGYKLVLCHFPFQSWERGYINLHGHVHSLQGYQNRWMQYDVGADANNYTPILLEDVVKRAQAGIKPVDHY